MKYVLITILAAAISPASASAIYSDQSGWRILEVHETFSMPRRHSHCTAYRSLGDQTLFIDIDREFVENASMTENTMILRYFDNSIPNSDGDSMFDIQLQIDGKAVIDVQGSRIKHVETDSGQGRQHNPYTLSLVDENSSSLNLRSDGKGKTFIDNTPKTDKHSKDEIIFSGVQLNLNVDQGWALVQGSKVLGFNGLLREFPLEGFEKAAMTAVECNRNVLTAEYRAQQDPNLAISNPYETLIQQGLPDSEENVALFVSRLTELAREFAPSLANQSSNLLSSEQLAELNLPPGTLLAWSGSAADGSLYYSPHVFDDLRRRKLSDIYDGCKKSGGFTRLTGVKQRSDLGLIFNEQVFSCGNVNGDSNLNTYHFTASIHSEIDGASLGIDDAIIAQMSESDAEATWKKISKNYPELSEQ